MTSAARDRTIALAGVFQSAALVKQLAREGQVEEPFFGASLNSFIHTGSSELIDVFGGPGNIQLGLKILHNQLNGQRDMEITRYVVGVIHLEKRMKRKPKMLKKISRGIELVKNQASHFHPSHDNVIANIAQLYTDTLHSIYPPIMVVGDPGHLNAKGNPEKIRALLFAGVRAAVLWRSAGGGRVQLFLSRQQYSQQAEILTAN